MSNRIETRPEWCKIGNTFEWHAPHITGLDTVSEKIIGYTDDGFIHRSENRPAYETKFDDLRDGHMVKAYAKKIAKLLADRDPMRIRFFDTYKDAVRCYYEELVEYGYVEVRSCEVNGIVWDYYEEMPDEEEDLGELNQYVASGVVCIEHCCDCKSCGNW